jgi:hypothetical protein
VKLTNRTGSTGPRTAAGKTRSSRNARTHGLFSRELRLSKAEVPEFARLHSELKEELKPNTVMQSLLFDDLVVCIWILKLALRYEQSAICKLSGANDATTPSSFSPGPLGWTRHKRLELIDEIQERITRGQDISQDGDLAKRVLEAFDENFWKLLTEWTSESPAKWALAGALDKKCELFGLNFAGALRDSVSKTAIPPTEYSQG